MNIPERSSSSAVYTSHGVENRRSGASPVAGALLCESAPGGGGGGGTTGRAAPSGASAGPCWRDGSSPGPTRPGGARARACRRARARTPRHVFCMWGPPFAELCCLACVWMCTPRPTRVPEYTDQRAASQRLWTHLDPAARALERLRARKLEKTMFADSVSKLQYFESAALARHAAGGILHGPGQARLRAARPHWESGCMAALPQAGALATALRPMAGRLPAWSRTTRAEVRFCIFSGEFVGRQRFARARSCAIVDCLPRPAARISRLCPPQPVARSEARLARLLIFNLALWRSFGTQAVRSRRPSAPRQTSSHSLTPALSHEARAQAGVHFGASGLQLEAGGCGGGVCG